MYKISIGTSKTYKAVTFYTNDRTDKIQIEPYKFDISRIHVNNLNSIKNALRDFLHIQDSKEHQVKSESELIVEIKDRSVIKWVQTGGAPNKYSKEFMEFLGILDEVPCIVHFIYIEDPISLLYANKLAYSKYIKEEQSKMYSSSIDDMLSQE